MSTENKTNIERVFGSFDEFVAYSLRDLTGQDGSSRRRDDRTTWAGGSWESAVSMLSTGWAEGLDRVKPLSAGITSEISGRMTGFEVQYAVAGSYPDVGRFLSGEPENMCEFAAVEVDGSRILKLTVSLSVSAGLSTDAMIRKGAAVIALVDLLELSGRDVEIFINLHQTSYRAGDGSWECMIPVKRAGEIIERDRLAYCLANPSFYRRICFSTMEQEPEAIRNRFGYYMGGGYGGQGPVAERFRGDITIDQSNYHFGSDESARQWVIDQLTKQGVELDLTRKAA